MQKSGTELKRRNKNEHPKHYWICSDCAEAKGWKWPKGHVATMIWDTCPYCDKTAVLSCYDDWDRPGVNNYPARD